MKVFLHPVQYVTFCERDFLSASSGQCVHQNVIVSALIKGQDVFVAQPVQATMLNDFDSVANKSLDRLKLVVSRRLAERHDAKFGFCHWSSFARGSSVSHLRRNRIAT